MGPGTFVGRLGPSAAALGFGVAIAISGSPAAGADPARDSTTATADRDSGSRADRSARRPAAPAVPRQALPMPAAASSAPPVRARKSPITITAIRRSTAARPVSVVKQPLPQHVSADAAGADPLRTLFGNTTPALTPSQTGQSAGGVVTGRLNASDPDSAALTYRVVAGPARGTVVVGIDGSYAYAADPAFAATGTTDSFRVSVSDAGSGFHLHGLAGLLNLLTFGLIGSSGHTRETTVQVVVTPFGLTNTAPTGTPIIDTTNTITGAVTGRVVGVDADRDVLTYTASAATPKGIVSLNATSGAFTYQPGDSARQNAAAVGATDADRSDTFTVTVADGRGGSVGVVVTVPVIPVSVEPSTPLPAFPGAEGFGASATGGRGGSVIYVTNLDADGPGSLQWAIDQPGARYILFKVSGVINTQIHLTNGDVTIAGQTSPGGITLRGFVTDESPFQDQDVRAPSDFAENWILQHIRIRPGANGPSDDGLRLRYTRNAIVDHVSIGNATDEAVEISYSRDITVQNSVIAETVGGHSFYGGVLMNYSNPAHGFGLDNIALHHNVFNRIEGRLPEGSRESLAAAGSYMNLELSNNLYWDPNFFIALGPDTGTVTGPSGPYPIYWNLNAVNNFFQIRNGFPYGMFDDQIMRTSLNRLYVSGNQMSGYPGRSDYELFYCCNDYPSVIDPSTGSQIAQKLSARHPFPAITYTPTGQLRTVLLNTAGAWPRDPMDTRLMQNVAANTIASAPRNTNPAGDALLTAYSGSAPPPPQDTDNDGMPDSWETAKGLNPTAANTNARTLSTVGYTDLEVYLQELSGSRISGWNPG